MYYLTDWVRRINFDKMRQERYQNLQEKMGQYGLDALVSFRVENIKYAADIHPSFFPSVPIRNIAIVKRGAPAPVGYVASGNWKHRQATTYWMKPEDIFPLPYMETRTQVEKASPHLQKSFESLGVTGGLVGVDLITLDILSVLKALLPTAEFVTGEDCLNEAKELKNGEEIKCVTMAAACVDIGMEAARGAVEIGKREGEILGEGMKEMYRLGMQMPQGMPFVASGEENLYPLVRFATDRIVRAGELLVASFGGYFNGMWAEAKRTFCCGRPNSRQKEIYGAVWEANEAALKAIRPGASSQEVMEAVTGSLQQHGLADYQLKQPLAHGIGVSGWEPPFIECGAPPFRLEPGMVLTLEPAVAVPEVPGGGTVAIGNMLVVTDAGNEVITRCSYENRLA